MDTTAGAARARRSTDDGFTLIELLVVMIIIGILAAIAVPTFLGQKAKARETSAKSDVKQISKEVVGFYIDGTGPLALEAGATPRTWKLTDSASMVVATGPLSEGNSVAGSGTITSSDAYCVAVTPAQAGARAWHINQNGLFVGPC